MTILRAAFSNSLLALACCGAALPAQQQTAQDAAAVALRREKLHDAGLKAPLTLYPVRVLGKPNPQVAEAMGLVLERYGMPDLEVATAAFEPPEGTKWDDMPARFGAHLKQTAAADAPARHHLYAEFLGTPRTGPEEVRFLIVDGAGELIWSDQQTKADADFQRTAAKDPDPLGCSMLVSERLFIVARWKKALGSIRDGKFSTRWRTKSGVPDGKELTAMKQRAAKMRESRQQSRIVVLPTLVIGKHDVESSARLASQLQPGLVGTATAGGDGIKLVIAPDSNQQKRLWDLARALRGALAKTPVDADYAMVADLGLDAERGAGFVNVVVCDQKGDYVLVEFLNDQHPLFQRHSPKSLADAERLAIARLGELLR